MLKRLASDTAIYGLPSIVGRALNFLLVPLYTRIFSEAEYGTVSLLYSIIPVVMVLLVFRLETAYFRFGTREMEQQRAFHAVWRVLLVSTPLALGIIALFAPALAEWLLGAAELRYLIYLSVGILFFDVLSELPFARLRLLGRARTFAGIRMVNILLNIGINVFFLIGCRQVPALAELAGPLYDPAFGIGYIFVANLVAAAVTLLLLLWTLRTTPGGVGAVLDAPKESVAEMPVGGFNLPDLRPMLRYAAPLVVAGLAGIVNEVVDRLLLNFLLPLDAEAAKAEVGIYSAVYKLSIFLTLITQAYRYAAEPIFFKQSQRADATRTYADMAEYFCLVGTFAFLVISLFLPLFGLFIGEKFRVGLPIVPVLLLANLFLGLYYNVSVWFKVTDRTKYGALIAVAGAAVTIGLNVLLIPSISYLGSAWATFACYAVMLVLGYALGQRFYPVPYALERMLGYVGSAVAIFGWLRWWGSAGPFHSFAIVGLILWAVIAAVIFRRGNHAASRG